MNVSIKRVLMLSGIVVLCVAFAVTLQSLMAQFHWVINAEGSLTVTVTAQVLLLSLGGFIGINSIRSATDLQDKYEAQSRDFFTYTLDEADRAIARMEKYKFDSKTWSETLALMKESMRLAPLAAERAEHLAASMIEKRRQFTTRLWLNLWLGLFGLVLDLLGVTFALGTWAAPYFASAALAFFLGQLSTFVIMIREGLKMMSEELPPTPAPGTLSPGAPVVGEAGPPPQA